jgi:peptidoglycan/LPS O-acetylase OafA/YrhL
MAAWSLGVEMYFYIMMALGLARGRVIALLWLAAAVLWHAHLFATVPAWQDRYFTVGAGALPFAVGVCLWQFRDALPRLALPVTLGILFAFLAHSQAAGWLWGGYDAARALPLYLSLALVAVGVLGLSRIDPRSVHPRLRRIDTWLGDLAYPIFVLHQAVAVAVWYALGGAPETKWSAYAYSLIPLHVAAVAVVVLVERPLFGLRAKVRQGALRLQDLRLPVGRDQTARNEAV